MLMFCKCDKSLVSWPKHKSNNVIYSFYSRICLVAYLFLHRGRTEAKQGANK